MMTQAEHLPRRGLLRGALAAALTAPLAAAPALAQQGGRRSIPRDNISITWSTGRGGRTEPAEETVKRLAALGYKRIEGGGGDMAAAEWKALCAKYRINPSSSFTQLPQPWNPEPWTQAVVKAAAIGQRYINTPASPIDLLKRPVTPAAIAAIKGLRTAAQWRAFAADCNKAGRIAREHGLDFGFHSHFWEFLALDDDTPLTGYDIMLAETDPALVHFELDLYWAWFGHRDPVQLITTLGPRIKQLHVKDMTYADHKATWTDPGTGVIDFARIFAAIKDPSAYEFIIERDDAQADTAAAGFKLLSQVRF